MYYTFNILKVFYDFSLSARLSVGQFVYALTHLNILEMPRNKYTLLIFTMSSSVLKTECLVNIVRSQ